MARSWWSLPGPSAFVDALAQDVRDGKNVVVCLPRHEPAGMIGALKASLHEWSWDRFDVDPGDERPPVAQLYDRYVPGPGEPAELRNAGTLVRESAFAGHLVWLDGVCAQGWPDWEAFLAEYAHACRPWDHFDLPLFCVALRGELALCPPASDTRLTVHRWYDAVDGLDMLLYAADLLRHRPLPPLQKRIAVAAIAQVANWDPDVAERLAVEDLATILAPSPVLYELAAERGWGPECSAACRDVGDDRVPDAAWLAGLAAFFDGRPVIHSAAVVAFDPSDRMKEIDRRLWQAQVGVLLPLIEERRRWIIERFGRAFRLPHFPDGNRNAPIHDPRDLEIGHIYHQIEFQHVDLGEDVQRLVRRLKKARDRLAHLRPLDAESLATEGGGLIGMYY